MPFTGRWRSNLATQIDQTRELLCNIYKSLLAVWKQHFILCWPAFPLQYLNCGDNSESVASKESSRKASNASSTPFLRPTLDAADRSPPEDADRRRRRRTGTRINPKPSKQRDARIRTSSSLPQLHGKKNTETPFGLCIMIKWRQKYYPSNHCTKMILQFTGLSRHALQLGFWRPVHSLG